MVYPRDQQGGQYCLTSTLKTSTNGAVNPQQVQRYKIGRSEHRHRVELGREEYEKGNAKFCQCRAISHAPVHTEFLRNSSIVKELGILVGNKLNANQQ